MTIKHGNNIYTINFVAYIISSNGITSTSCLEMDRLVELLKFEYSELNFDSYVEFCKREIDDIRNWVDMGKAYNANWKSVYLYAGIVGNEVLVSKNGTILGCRMHEKYDRLKEVSDDFICKIECYGWNVSSIKETGVSKITYFTKTKESNPIKYPIYAYKDYVILGNGDSTKPSIITSKYFLYNGGEKDE